MAALPEQLRGPLAARAAAMAHVSVGDDSRSRRDLPEPARQLVGGNVDRSGQVPGLVLLRTPHVYHQRRVRAPLQISQLLGCDQVTQLSLLPPPSQNVESISFGPLEP